MKPLKPVAVLLRVFATAGLDPAASRSCLTDAVERRSPALVATVFTPAADVNGLQPDGATPLHRAEGGHDLKTVVLMHRYSLFASANGSAATTTVASIRGADAMPPAQLTTTAELLQRPGATEQL